MAGVGAFRSPQTQGLPEMEPPDLPRELLKRVLPSERRSLGFGEIA